MEFEKKRAERCYHAIQAFYRNVKDKSQAIEIRYPHLADILYAAKIAADAVGLKYSHGCIYTRNNWYHCRYFFIPGEHSTCLQDGRDAYTYQLEDVYIFSVERKKPKNGKDPSKYFLCKIDNVKKVKKIKKLVDCFLEHSEIRSFYQYDPDIPNIPDKPDKENWDVTLDEKTLCKFLTQYANTLCQFGIISSSKLDCMGWRHFGGEFSYITPTGFVFCNPQETEEMIDRYLPTAIFTETSLWVAASLFSLLKPLYNFCRIKCTTGFALQILVESHQDLDSHKAALKLLELQARMWCNFREWPENHNSEPLSEFRKVYGEDFSLEYRENFGFPIAIFGYCLPDGEQIDANWTESEDEKYYEDYDEYSEAISLTKGNGTASKPFLQRVCSANCLPILIPGITPKRNYAREMCLTIPLAVHRPETRLRNFDPAECRSERDEDGMRNLHEKINKYYVRCMEIVGGDKAEIKKGLQDSIKEASNMLGVLPKKNQNGTDQLKVLLSALYFVRNTLEAKGQETKRLRILIYNFEQQYLGVATIRDFAAFVEDELEKPITHNSVIFHQDDDRIYLRYQKYWPAFQRYCKKSNIRVSISASAFRRNVLAPKKLIQPQYQVSSDSQYPRYDYRKKVDDTEENVLNLSRKILQQF